MKKTLIALAVAGAMTAPMIAQAAAPAQGFDAMVKDKLSVTASYQTMDVEDVEMDAVGVELNYELTDVFGLEVAFANGVGSDTADGVDFERGFSHSVALTAEYPLSPRISAIGQLGYEEAEYELSAPGFSETEDDEMWVYHAGLKYSTFANALDLTAEITGAIGEDEEGYILGATYNFANSPFSVGAKYAEPFDNDEYDMSELSLELTYDF